MHLGAEEDAVFSSKHGASGETPASSPTFAATLLPEQPKKAPCSIRANHPPPEGSLTGKRPPPQIRARHAWPARPPPHDCGEGRSPQAAREPPHLPDPPPLCPMAAARHTDRASTGSRRPRAARPSKGERQAPPPPEPRGLSPAPPAGGGGGKGRRREGGFRRLGLSPRVAAGGDTGERGREVLRKSAQMCFTKTRKSLCTIF